MVASSSSKLVEATVFDVDDRAGPECTGSRELFRCEAPLD
jgi:hypothetical protein